MERAQATELIHNLLRGMLSKKASDLFITGGFPPAFKVDGKMTPVSPQALTCAHTQELARSIMNDQPGSRIRGHARMQLRHQPARHRALPRQCLHATAACRHGVAHHHHQDSRFRRNGPAAAC